MKTQWNKGLLIAPIFAMAVSFAACGNTPNNNTSAKTEETNRNTKNVVEKDVSFTDENGKTVTLSSLKGKVVFINFWATWCPPCREEMPTINTLRQKFKDNDQIVFLMVDVDGKMKKSKAFMEKNKYDLPVYAPKSSIPPDFLGNAVPTTIILDKNGKIAGRVEGSMDYSSPEVIKSLKELIQSN